jgi:hypothetical protein
MPPISLIGEISDFPISPIPHARAPFAIGDLSGEKASVEGNGKSLIPLITPSGSPAKPEQNRQIPSRRQSGSALL